MISSISTRSVRDWRSNEPGAWVIVLMPALSAFLVSDYMELRVAARIVVPVLLRAVQCCTMGEIAWARTVSHADARLCRAARLRRIAVRVQIPRHAMVGSDLLRAVRGVANLCMATP